MPYRATATYRIAIDISADSIDGIKDTQCGIQNSLKDAIKSAMGKYDIEDITVIDDYPFNITDVERY